MLFIDYPISLFLFSAILTWGGGLLIPILLRYVFIRKPINKSWAKFLVVILFIIQFIIWVGFLGSTSKSHIALFLIAYVSYQILTKDPKKKYGIVKESDDIDLEVK